MAHLRDWLNLGRSTLAAVNVDHVTSFYAREWPETRRALIAEHRGSIDGERGAIRRYARTASAVLYGLANRLAPHRRILFVLSWVLFFLCLFSLFTSMAQAPVATFVQIAGTFMVITLLLAMELIDKIKFRDELELARELQAGLIPTVAPRTETYEIGAFNHIANTVGGDIYDFVVLPDGRIAVLFGDASGHGMAAGLVMAVAHAAFRTQLDIDESAAAILGSLNRILCRTGGPRSFFTCCYVLLSPDGTFSATLAGHPPILRLDVEGRIVERIGRGAYPLGIKRDLQWEEVRGTLAAGERLLLHSDGLTETRTASGREFGDAYVEAIASWHPQASAQAIVDALVREWKMFCGSTPAEDDVSVAVIARRGTRHERHQD